MRVRPSGGLVRRLGLLARRRRRFGAAASPSPAGASAVGPSAAAFGAGTAARRPRLRCRLHGRGCDVLASMPAVAAVAAAERVERLRVVVAGAAPASAPVASVPAPDGTARSAAAALDRRPRVRPVASVDLAAAAACRVPPRRLAGLVPASAVGASALELTADRSVRGSPVADVVRGAGSRLGSGARPICARSIASISGGTSLHGSSLDGRGPGRGAGRNGGRSPPPRP